MHHRNLASKSGAAYKQCAAKFFKASAYNPRKQLRQADLIQLAKADRELQEDQQRTTRGQDVVIVAAAPHAPMKKVETRFTLPDVPNNTELFLQHYLRTHCLLHDVMNELKTCMKVRGGAVDPEHVEVLSA